MIPAECVIEEMDNPFRQLFLSSLETYNSLVDFCYQVDNSVNEEDSYARVLNMACDNPLLTQDIAYGVVSLVRNKIEEHHQGYGHLRVLKEWEYDACVIPFPHLLHCEEDTIIFYGVKVFGPGLPSNRIISSFCFKPSLSGGWIIKIHC